MAPMPPSARYSRTTYLSMGASGEPRSIMRPTGYQVPRHSVPPAPHRDAVVLGSCAARARALGLLKHRQVMAMRTMTVSLALATAACGGGPHWPAAKAVVDSSFAGARRPVATVDVLPVDLQVWASPGTERNPEELSGALQVSVSGMVAAELASRGYQVTSQMDWDGTYVAPDGAVEHAMSEEQIAQTAYSLSGFGEAQRQVRGRILVPFLPVRLGGATGAEATLYVGGWAYAGKDKKGSSTAAKVAKGILIGVAIIAVVAIAIAARDGKAGEALGAVAEGTAKAA